MMLNKIPTAEEISSKHGIVVNKTNTLSYTTKSNCKSAMIEFAKLHVKAAIRECIESAPSGSSTDTVSYEDVVEALKDCYPETNIV